MATFRYEATDRDGSARTGFLTAGTIRQAIDELSARGLVVRRVLPAQEGDDEPLDVTEFLDPLSEEASANVAQLLSDVVTTELPLEPALRAAAEDAPRAEGRVLERVADLIAAGTPPSEAFIKVGESLPSHLLALIIAGLERGDLARLLSRYLTLVRQRSEERRLLWLGLTYPLILFTGVVVLLLAIMLWIVPQFEKIFDDFGTQLPWITQFVVWVSQVMRSFAWPALAVLAFFGLMFGLYWFLMRRRGVTIASLPGFEIFGRTADWGRFCGLLGLLVEGGQPLPQALRLASASATSPKLRRAGAAMAADVESGLTPWEASLPRKIPKPIQHVFRWAHRQDLFAEGLAGLSEIYSRRARVVSGFVGIVIEPFVLTFTAVTMGMLATALFMPLIKLLNDIS